MLDTSKNSDSKQRRETDQNMTRSIHRKWGQAINACPHFAKSYGIVGAIFAEYLGSVSAAASENPSLLFY